MTARSLLLVTTLALSPLVPGATGVARAETVEARQAAAIYAAPGEQSRVVTRIRAGDELIIVTTTRVRDAAERRVRAVSEEGRLAGWAARRRGPRGGQPPRV